MGLGIGFEIRVERSMLSMKVGCRGIHSFVHLNVLSNLGTILKLYFQRSHRRDKTAADRTERSIRARTDKKRRQRHRFDG